MFWIMFGVLAFLFFIMAIVMMIAYLPFGNKRATYFLLSFMILWVFLMGFFVGGILWTI